MCVRMYVFVNACMSVFIIGYLYQAFPENEFARAFFRTCSFSKQHSHVIMQLSFPIFELCTIKYQAVGT